MVPIKLQFIMPDYPDVVVAEDVAQTIERFEAGNLVGVYQVIFDLMMAGF